MNELGKLNLNPRFFNAIDVETLQDRGSVMRKRQKLSLLHICFVSLGVDRSFFLIKEQVTILCDLKKLRKAKGQLET